MKRGTLFNSNWCVLNHTKIGEKGREQPDRTYDEVEVQMCLSCTRDKCSGRCKKIIEYKRSKRNGL